MGALVGADVGAPTPDFHALSEIIKRTDPQKRKTPFSLVIPTKTGFKSGSGGRIRTCDQLVNSQLRYHCATPDQSIFVASPLWEQKWVKIYLIVPQLSTRDSLFLRVFSTPALLFELAAAFLQDYTLHMAEHIYVHVPFCDGKCHYCGFYSVMASPQLTVLYRGLPAQELEQVLSAFPRAANKPVRTVFFGGGTPSLLGSEGLKALKDSLGALLSFEAVSEWTVELNPASVTPDLLRTLQALGVNRISIGVQSFSDATLARVGRRHTAEAALRAIRLALDMGFANTGIDLIAGLPGVEPHEWRETLDRATSLGLKHLSVYALTVEPETPLGRQIAEGLAVPDEQAQLDALTQAEDALTHAGFVRYEISNYAQPGFECQHNLGIWRGNDYIGLGPAAASRIGLKRWTNSEDLSDYIEALSRRAEPPRAAATLKKADDAVERAVYALRLKEGLDPFEASERFPALRERADRWETRLAGLARQGITERAGSRWRLTARGREVCDAAIRELL